MANQLYPSAREGFLTGQYNWATDDFSFVLLDADYTFDPVHVLLSSIPTGAQVGGVQPITSKGTGSGFAVGSSIQYTELYHTEDLTQAIIVQDTGDVATSALVVYYDTIDGFPFQPTGDNYDLFSDLLFGGYFRL